MCLENIQAVQMAVNMSKKMCDAWTCTKSCPKKYRYCYDCAKRKGLTGESDWFVWLFWIIVIGSIFNWIL